MIVHPKWQKAKSAQLIRQKTRNIWLPQQDYQVLESLVLMPGVSLDRPDRHASPSFEKQGFGQTKLLLQPGWAQIRPAVQTWAQLRVLAAGAKWHEEALKRRTQVPRNTQAAAQH